MELKGEWVTYPADSIETGKNIIVTIRTDIAEFMANPRFKYRITVAWDYTADTTGMPDEATSEMIEQITERFDNILRKDPVAVMTEITTGDGCREWVFQTLSLGIFNKKLNEALAPFPLLPLRFDAEEDPDWDGYKENLPPVEER